MSFFSFDGASRKEVAHRPGRGLGDTTHIWLVITAHRAYRQRQRTQHDQELQSKRSHDADRLIPTAVGSSPPISGMALDMVSQGSCGACGGLFRCEGGSLAE